MRKPLSEHIRKQLFSLYFLDSQGAINFLRQLDELPDKALEDISEILRQAQHKQNDFLEKNMEIDPHFFEELKGFLDAQITSLIASSKLNHFT